MSKVAAPLLARRDVLQLAALSGVATWLPGCAGGKDTDSGASIASSDSSDSASGVDSAGTDTGADTGTGDMGGWTWASGGTAGMTGAAYYTDPFTSPVTTCATVRATTEGPCTTATDLVRQDISEGWRGLPVRLTLRIVDASCAPLVGARVRVWHTNIEGSYSGETPNNRMCLQDQAYAELDFFRGAQDTDAAGVVRFDTCYPGWYPGRTIHVHFQVVVGGVTTEVSQLFFPESVTNAVFTEHPDYVPFGQPDTTLTTDSIARGLGTTGLAPLTLDINYERDGALVASRTVAVG